MITAEEFDKRFDDGEDITKYIDPKSIKKLHTKKITVNIKFPQWLIQAMDEEAKIIGITRTAIIKIWLVEKARLLQN